jgi:hypothetical protein
MLLIWTQNEISVLSDMSYVHSVYRHHFQLRWCIRDVGQFFSLSLSILTALRFALKINYYDI